MIRLIRVALENEQNEPSCACHLKKKKKKTFWCSHLRAVIQDEHGM